MGKEGGTGGGKGGKGKFQEFAGFGSRLRKLKILESRVQGLIEMPFGFNP